MTELAAPSRLWDALEHYVEQGWLRALDLELARWLAQQKPETEEAVLLAAVLTSHQLGRGHICLDLEALLADPESLLALPPGGRRAETLPRDWLAGLTLSGWRERLAQAEVVDTEEAGCAPLVLDGHRLYLRRFYRFESEVARALQSRQALRFPLPDDVSQRLSALFDPLKDDAERAGREPHWQSIAAALAARSALAVISGGPGTGKTTTVVRLLALLQGLKQDEQRQAAEEPTGLRIRLAAPTGKAAARLSESLAATLGEIKAGNVAGVEAGVASVIPTEVSTLHRLLGARPDSRFFRHNADNPLHLDLLVVDEASMVDLEMMAALLSALPPRARLILLGDKDQLASVEAGAVLGDLCRFAGDARYQADTRGFVYRATGYDLESFQGPGGDIEQQIVMLRKSHRFGADSGIGNLARAVNGGAVSAVKATWDRFGDITALSPASVQEPALKQLVLDGIAAGLEGQPKGYRHYLSVMAAGLNEQGCGPEEEAWARSVLNAFGEFQLLCAVREGEWGVSGLNDRVTSLLGQAGLIDASQPWYAGRPVMMMRNDYGLGLMNGDIGICLPFAGESGEPVLRVVFPMPDGTLKRVLPSRLTEVETVFAMTVHKSQGSEFAHTAMVLPADPNPVLTRELVYTGITRARRWFTLVAPRPALLDNAIRQRTQRASGLGERLK
ncbi:exodeoxyribonuclease V subunit alpha [Ferrimonas balearica]|uniref:exodeoxyribonuclease V subunit alpha n=1 Tax=Ferrimonas balearica TaxID=44012 RepID=UPI001C993D97|nr:exodeoxyribonuclease V subunit alpha [Ferrimonas balearica]MBY5921040.1 exodeoxyribonuclease V subunit alpha [Ferrimonas balearica]MBY5996275.1 exodeoxyribonuclease V subunit alpha [Ferrimonas balearica]